MTSSGPSGGCRSRGRRTSPLPLGMPAGGGLERLAALGQPGTRRTRGPDLVRNPVLRDTERALVVNVVVAGQHPRTQIQARRLRSVADGVEIALLDALG